MDKGNILNIIYNISQSGGGLVGSRDLIYLKEKMNFCALFRQRMEYISERNESNLGSNQFSLKRQA